MLWSGWGGVKAEDPLLAHKIACQKLVQAHETGADVLATTGPFCERNFKDSCRSGESKLEILDLIELIDRALEQNDDTS